MTMTCEALNFQRAHSIMQSRGPVTGNVKHQEPHPGSSPGSGGSHAEPDRVEFSSAQSHDNEWAWKLSPMQCRNNQPWGFMSPALHRIASLAAASLLICLPVSMAAAQVLPAPVTKVPDAPALVATRGTSVKTLVEEAMKEIVSTSPGPVSSEEGNCMDYAAMWSEPLKAREIPAVLALTDSSMGKSEVALQDGRKIFYSKFHAFVVIRDGDRELILDPTWKQFVADKQAARDLPSILLGTVDEIKEIYAGIQPQLQLETTGADPLQGRYDVSSAVDLLYSSGPNAHLRQMLE